MYEWLNLLQHLSRTQGGPASIDDGKQNDGSKLVWLVCPIALLYGYHKPFQELFGPRHLSLLDCSEDLQEFGGMSSGHFDQIQSGPSICSSSCMWFEPLKRFAPCLHSQRWQNYGDLWHVGFDKTRHTGPSFFLLKGITVPSWVPKVNEVMMHLVRGDRMVVLVQVISRVNFRK